LSTGSNANPKLTIAEDIANPENAVFSQTAITDPTIFIARFSTSTKVATVKITGFSEESATHTVSTISNAGAGSETLRIGAQKTSNSDRFFDGYIHEIIVYDRYLSNSEISAIEEYLQDKWDI
jgi:aminopeptidase C